MNKLLFCFGSGSYFQIMYQDYKSRFPDYKVEGVIDNNNDKVGKSIMIGTDSIPILSLSDVMDRFRPEEIKVCVTTAFHSEIMTQLSQFSYFDNVEIYSYNDIKIKEVDDYIKLDTSLGEPLIPKRIHYCWFGGKQMPPHLQREVDNWRKLCPDYEFICWNESNYDIEKIPYTKEAYENRRWGHLPDYVRLDVVHEHGGIYLDTDVELLVRPDELRKNNAFFATEVNGGINEGSGFGATKGHPFVKELMSVYENIKVGDPLMLTTSLGKEISTFHNHGYINNGKFQIIDGVAIYPYQVLSPVIKETGQCMKTAATVGIHHFEGSWC